MLPPAEFLPTALAHALRQPLPGGKAHRRMAPELAYSRHDGPPSRSAREAAVLVLLYPVDQVWHLLLTVRPTAMGTHAGQICFPGGASEPRETPEVAAVREYAEEVGGASATIEHIGRLSPVYVFNSNFHVTPCVAVTREPPEFFPSPAEVAAILEVPLPHLADHRTQGRMLIERRGLTFSAPCFEYGERRIWGATALMIAELLMLLETTAVVPR